MDNLTLEIPRGQIYAFIGHNGAGKTTTIKACMGILDFDCGEIFIDGTSIKENPMKTKSVTAYIPDNPEMYEFLSGISYLNFVADVYGVPEDVRRERIATYAEKLGLTADLGEKIGAYSHGMRQKLAIISAWLHAPKLVIMDEPFVGLDPRASHTLKEMMRELCDAGGSIFFSTHVLDVAEKLCDSVAIIKDGKLVSFGSMEEIKGDSSLESVFLDLEDANG